MRMPKGVFKRGRYFYTRVRAAGRDRWVSLGGDRDQVRARLLKVRGGEIPQDQLTLGEAAARWIESYVRTARNEKGARIAEVRVRKYLDPFLGAHLVARVGGNQLRSYRLWLERQSIATQTVAHVLADARCLLNWCESSGIIDRAPSTRRLLPRIQERPPDRLSDDQLAKLTCLREPYGFVIWLALGTGLRWGELCRTQASHVDRGMLVVHQTKSGKLRRVPLAPELAQEVSRRVGRLVGFPESNPMSFTRTVRRLSGVQEFHVHQLRHSFACRWLEAGGSLAALQQVLGHSTVVTTQRYARLDENAVCAEALRVQAVAKR